MTIELHLQGVQECLFVRDKDAEIFLSCYKQWAEDRTHDRFFEYFHNGSVHCFLLSAVAYLKFRMATDAQTRDVALQGPLIRSDSFCAHH